MYAAFNQMNELSSRRTSRSYWLIVLVLVALGFLTIFSFGLYFWFIAVALIVMDLSVRDHRFSGPGLHCSSGSFSATS